MNRLDRHDYILMARRKRERAAANRPRIWLRIGQALLVFLLLLVVSGIAVTGVLATTVVGVYNEYATQLPDVGVIEQQQDQFQTVRLYDRTGTQLLYESVDPRPFGGDRRFLSRD